MSEATGIGRLVDGKYQIIEQIGRGGMSNVWLARDKRLGKLWAVKEIKPNVSGTQGEALRRAIVDEANFMKHLDHPAIPRVVDIIDTGATVFVVMDYVEGRALSRVMQERGKPFDQADVVNWGIQLCDVLGYLHRRNPQIIYRDMKPANVILRDDGTVRLIDFGVCMERKPGRCNDGRIVGTPGYASPEQIPQHVSHLRELDPDVVIDDRTDVYALGVTLYTLVTGHTPTLTKDRDGRERVSFRMRPIRVWNPRLSEGLERIIVHATQTNPAQRYATMDEMRYDLERYEELTQEWRDAQRRKIKVFWRWMAGCASSVALGFVCLAISASITARSYDALMHRAQEASRSVEGDEASEAERLYAEAIALMPRSVEPYRKLLEVYEHDYRFTAGEDGRWRRAFMHAQDLANDKEYAQLCFDVGASYLSYFGIDKGGGSVGNAAIMSAEAAAPWFRRVLDACGESEDHNGQRIDDANVRAASVYRVVTEFYQNVTRAGREGKGVSEEYTQFWEVLCSTVGRESDARDGRKSAEGVRVRLYQIASETLSSSTYLAGFARAGITEAMARELLQRVRQGVEELGEFAHANEYREVYQPVFQEIATSLALVEQNIRNVYGNPVAAASDGLVRDGEEAL